MNYFKKMVSAALILSMLAALVPAAVFAAVIYFGRKPEEKE